MVIDFRSNLDAQFHRFFFSINFIRIVTFTNTIQYNTYHMVLKNIYIIILYHLYIFIYITEISKTLIIFHVSTIFNKIIILFK